MDAPTNTQKCYPKGFQNQPEAVFYGIRVPKYRKIHFFQARPAMEELTNNQKLAPKDVQNQPEAVFYGICMPASILH